MDLENQIAKNFSLSDLSVSDSTDSEDDTKPIDIHTIKYQKFILKNIYLVIIMFFLFHQVVYAEPKDEKIVSILIFVLYYTIKKNFKEKKKSNKE